MEYSWIVLLFLNGFLCAILLSRRKRRRGEPPLVRHKYPFIGGTFDFGKSPLQYLQKLKAIYGDVYTVFLAGKEVHFFSNPIDVKYLEKSRDLKHDNVLYDFATRLVGSPHAIDAGGENNPRGPELMRTLSKTMRGSTHLSRLAQSCVATTTYAFQQALECDPRFLQRKSIPLYELCGCIIFDITFNMFFGYPKSAADRCAEKKRIYDDFKLYFESSALLVSQIPIVLLPKVNAARKNLLRQLAEFQTTNRIGVSDMVQSMENLDKDHLEERARHLLIILWSAQANSRPALFWIMLHILQHPTAGLKILEEYHQIMLEKEERIQDKAAMAASMKNFRQDQPLLSNWLGMADIAKVDRKDLDKMVVLDACIKESLRLVGSSMAVRQASKDTSIRVSSGLKYRVRKGDWTSVFSQVADMDPIIHENPEEYIYDRFLLKQDGGQTCRDQETTDDFSTHGPDQNGNVSRKHTSKPCFKARTQFGIPGYKVSSSRALLTFGYGTNRCPGRHIAMIEIKYCILVFLRYFNVSLLNPTQESPLFDRKHLGFGVMPPMVDIDVNISPKSS